MEGYYAMVVNPLIQGFEFTKCLMDGGSSLNIMYAETLTKLGLTKTHSTIVLSPSTEWFQVTKQNL
jgi:hypothetical protein